MSSMKNDKEYREQIRLKAKNDQQIDLTEEQIDMCIITEEQEKLSYFHGHLYINPRRTKVSGQWVNKVQWAKTIDGYRVLAQRNGLCRVDEPDWEDDDDGKLYACKVSIWRRGPDGYPEGPFVGIAHYHEFVQMVDEVKDGRRTGKKIPNRQWRTSPMNQLSVCAERQAHRKAGLDHTHISEEIVDVQPRETVEEAFEQEEVENGEEEQKAEAPKKEAPKKQGRTIEYKDAHRGSTYDGAMIVGTVSGPGWHAILLDSGKKVVFGREENTLTEQEISDRNDEFPGGFEWSKGATYYDGSKVVGVTTKNKMAVLELDSGFKVKLDQWGKELGRKKAEEASGPKPAADSEPAPAAVSPEFEEAMKAAEDSAGLPEEQLRKHMITLLAYWCKHMNGGVKIAPKTAYIELVGVAISENDRMRHEDYKALLETLADKIKEKAA